MSQVVCGCHGEGEDLETHQGVSVHDQILLITVIFEPEPKPNNPCRKKVLSGGMMKY